MLTQRVRAKEVLVTGASFGIGRALALRLGAAGAHLTLIARSPSELENVADEIRLRGGVAHTMVVDLASASSIEACISQLAAQGRVFDLVVHNAGKSIRRLITESLDRPHDYQRTMAVNYLGPVQLQLALLPAMISRGSGHIVNVSSVGVRLPPAPRWAAYVASKSAFDVWMRTASPELREHGIICTKVYLGLVHTRMMAPTVKYRTLPGQTPDEAAAALCRAIVKRPRALQPWWISVLLRLTPWCEGLVDHVLGRLLRRELGAETRDNGDVQ